MSRIRSNAAARSRLGQQRLDDARAPGCRGSPAASRGRPRTRRTTAPSDRSTAAIESMSVPSRSSSTPANGSSNGAAEGAADDGSGVTGIPAQPRFPRPTDPAPVTGRGGLVQPHRVRHGVPELVVVEVAVHPVPGALPLAQPVGPPAQVVVGVGAGVQVLAARPVPAHVDQVARGPQDARQVRAAHHDVGRAVSLEDAEDTARRATTGAGTRPPCGCRRQAAPGRGRAGRRRAPWSVAAGGGGGRRGRRAAACPAR